MDGRHYGNYRREELIRLRAKHIAGGLEILRPTGQDQTMRSQP